MRKGQERIPGYQEEIHPGVWQRHTIMGVPRKWTYAWMALCFYGVAYILYTLPLRLLFPLGVIWIVGQAGTVRLTKWDPQWDDVLLASFRFRRYKKRYEAG
jgi:type IV secretory pathway TrbD component